MRSRWPLEHAQHIKKITESGVVSGGEKNMIFSRKDIWAWNRGTFCLVVPFSPNILKASFFIKKSKSQMWKLLQVIGSHVGRKYGFYFCLPSVYLFTFITQTRKQEKEKVEAEISVVSIFGALLRSWLIKEDPETNNGKETKWKCMTSIKVLIPRNRANKKKKIHVILSSLVLFCFPII